MVIDTGIVVASGQRIFMGKECVVLDTPCHDVDGDDMNRYICRKSLGCTFRICSHSIYVLHEFNKLKYIVGYVCILVGRVLFFLA